MISLDSSIIPAILIFLALIFALNSLLFRPLLRVMDEREARTTGLVAKAHSNVEHYGKLFKQYQATIKNARLEGYRRQEGVRSEAIKKRSEALDQARRAAEQMVVDARATLQSQVQSAKEQLSREAREIGHNIAAQILQRSA